MKLYALTYIDADDKDQKKCGDCQMLWDMLRRYPRKKREVVCLMHQDENHHQVKLRHHGKAVYRCPACLAASAVHPLIRAIEEAPEYTLKTDIKEIDDNAAKFYGHEPMPGIGYIVSANRNILYAALDLKGKLK